MQKLNPLFLSLGIVLLGVPPRPALTQDTSARQRMSAAEQAAADRDSGKAVQLATEALQKDPTLADAYYLRGRERFRLGEFRASTEDFDRYLELRPDQRRRLWERGIACYYAGRYRDGVDQFTAYQDFDDSDVENAVWHVLCLSRIEGLAVAQRRMMKVKQDDRIPMMSIYRLFSGQGTPRDVLQTVSQSGLSEGERRAAYFYAHLYIGLFYEVSANERQAREHIVKAADEYRIGHYMGDVARVHADRWKSPTDTNP